MKNKASIGLCMGYGTGALGEAGFYQFVTSFQLIFLTGVVGLSPELAGTVTSLTILVEAVCSIVIGRFSDQLQWRYGRRRPFILFSVFFIPVTVLLSFTAIHQTTGIMLVYYTIMGALCWVAYSVFYIPYTALGAEIATDYDERIRIRTVSRVFTIAATFLATVLPLTVIGFFERRGATEAQGWFYFALIFGALVAVGLAVCWRSTRGTEVMAAPEERRTGDMEKDKAKEKESIWLVFQDFWQLLRIKSMAILIAAKIIFMAAFTFYTSGMMFFMEYRLGLGGEAISSIYLVTVVLTAVYTPIISKTAMRFGKQQQVIMAIFISGVLGTVLYFIGIDTYAMTVLYVVVFMYVQSSYWQISNAIFYDITEVDEYLYGKRREGSITALQSIAGTLAASLGLQMIGVTLKMAGFDASLAVQGQQAMTELGRIFVLYPSVGLLFSAALLYTYPVSKKRFEQLQKAIELKKRGEDYSMYEEELRKLI